MHRVAATQIRAHEIKNVARPWVIFHTCIGIIVSRACMHLRRTEHHVLGHLAKLARLMDRRANPARTHQRRLAGRSSDASDLYLILCPTLWLPVLTTSLALREGPLSCRSRDHPLRAGRRLHDPGRHLPTRRQGGRCRADICADRAPARGLATSREDDLARQMTQRARETGRAVTSTRLLAAGQALLPQRSKSTHRRWSNAPNTPQRSREVDAGHLHPASRALFARSAVLHCVWHDYAWRCTPNAWNCDGSCRCNCWYRRGRQDRCHQRRPSAGLARLQALELAVSLQVNLTEVPNFHSQTLDSGYDLWRVQSVAITHPITLLLRALSRRWCRHCCQRGEDVPRSSLIRGNWGGVHGHRRRRRR